MGKLLVIEKAGEIQALLRSRFSRNKVLVHAVRDVAAIADESVRTTYDVVIWDADGAESERSEDLEWLKGLSKDFPQTKIILVSAREEDKTRGQSNRNFSYQAVCRPLNKEKFCALVDLALHKESVAGEKNLFHPALHVPIEFEDILAVSLPMRAAIERMREAASTDIPVLITGETGTGKDLVAAAIHQKSKRRDFPYILVNTGAMTPELIASELFGHERGAYTGAHGAHQGFFEQADGGTIFLDEVSTMDEKAQVSLLRVLESKTFRRVGGRKDIQVDVRVIAATNENLEQAIKQKRFREDLFFRLDVFHISLPPLRDRPGGITLLTDHFVSHFNAVYGKQVKRVSRETDRCLRRYPWPGNVRELKNVIQRAVLMASGEELAPDLLPVRVREAGGANAGADRGTFPLHVGMTLGGVEREFIKMTLAATGGNKKEAALQLGISRRALYNKLKRHKLF